MNPLKIAQRMSKIEASGIRKFFDLAQKMKNPINLSIGQADFTPPAEAVDGAVEALRSGKNRYSVTQGISELNQALSQRVKNESLFTEDDDLMITSGVSGGILLSYLCTLDPGDEIMIPDPYFVMYKHLANAIGALPRTYSTFPDFVLTKQALEETLSPKTRCLLINSPSNPTGYVMSQEEIQLAADFAREHELLLISDETFQSFVYDREAFSPKQYYENTLVLRGFSKDLSVPGWRVGYAFGPQTLLEQMRVLQQFSFVCAPTPLQWGILEGLKSDFSAHRENYRQKRNRICAELHEGLRVVRPEGAFYVFPELPQGVSDQEFVARCIEKNLLVVPGSACSTRNTHVRISYAVDDKTLEKGIDVLNQVVASFL